MSSAARRVQPNFLPRAWAWGWLGLLLGLTTAMLILARDARSQDVRWEELGPPVRTYHSMVHDTRADRLLVFGGGTPGDALHNDVWAIELGSTSPSWRHFEVLGTQPPERAEHVAVFDSVGNRMVIFGGRNSQGALSDTWILELEGVPRWTQVDPAATAPSARWNAGAIFDPMERRMLVMGGRDGSANDPRDTWQFDLAGSLGWRPFPVLGIEMGYGNHVLPVTWGAAVHDPQTGQVAIQGGGITSFSLRSSSPEWVQQSTGPAYGLLSLDSAGRRLFLSGGAGLWQCQIADDAYRLEFTSIAQLAPAPDYRGESPRAVLGQAIVYDARRGRLLAYGGITLDQTSWGWLDGNLWTFDSAGTGRWSVLGSRPPKAALWPLFIHDTLRDELVYRAIEGEYDFRVFHTRGLSAEAPWVQQTDSAWTTNDFQAFQSFPTGGIYDPLRDRLVFFTGTTTGPSQLTQIPLQGPFLRQLLPVVGPSAPQSEVGRAVYDGARDRLIAVRLGADRNEVWAITLGGPMSWVRLDGTGRRPPVVDQPLWVHDADRDRIIMFGGATEPATAPQDTMWQLTLDGMSSWEAIPVANAPTGRMYGAAALDRIRQRIIVARNANTANTSTEVWALELVGAPRWHQLTSTGLAPGESRYASTLYDAVRDQILFYGGGWTERTLWVLHLGDQPTAALPSVLDASAEEGVIRVRWHIGEGAATVERTTERSDWVEVGKITADGSGLVAYEDQAVVAGTEYGYQLRLEDGSTTDPVFVVASDTPTTGLSLSGVQPNPSIGPLQISFRSGAEGRVALAVFDLAGRQVHAADAGLVPTGRHTITVDLGRLAAGIYFVRLTQGSAVATTRVVRLN